MIKDNNTSLSSGMIDSHFHLSYLEPADGDAASLLSSAFADGLTAAIDVGICSDDFLPRSKTALQYSNLYTAHGLYPSECNNTNLKAELNQLRSILLHDDQAVAVGEIGIDLYNNYGSLEKQESLFQEQLNLANELGFPVIIHSREALEQTLQLVTKHTPSKGGILHCFSYDIETAYKYIDLGFFISFAGNVTYKNSVSIQNAVSKIPLDSLLIETDSPYLTPQKVRGMKNYPGFIGYTYKHIAELRGISLEVLIESVKINFNNFISLKKA